MFGGGLTFLIGAALNGAAKNVAMLIVGRILLGIGVGFANQVLAYYSITHRHRSIDRLSITTDMHTYNYIRFQGKKGSFYFFFIGSADRYLEEEDAAAVMLCRVYFVCFDGR